jgi:hypothetical protein
MNKVWVAGKAVRLDPSRIIGVGGEAEVYALPGDMALKLYKAADHPDFAGDPAAQTAARLRLARTADILRAFPLPGPLSDHTIQPLEPALDGKGAVAGYMMRRAPRSVSLAALADPESRKQGWDEARIFAVFRDLHAQVSALHRLGVVIGDFNDYNVLVAGDAAYLIDLDSVQLPGQIAVQFTPRFLDPLSAHIEGNTMVLAQPYTPAADWYAFSALVMQSLLFVGPYGGLHRPTDPNLRVPEALRPTHRLTVFHPEVRYPKAARPVESLPEALEAHFRDVFINDRRLPFPYALLSGSPWTQCTECGLVHGRRQCPRCHVQPPAPVVRRGTVSIQKIVSASGVLVHTSIEGGRLSWIVWDGRRYLTETGAVCPGPAYDGWVRIERQGQRVWIGRDSLATGGREALRADVMAGLPQFAASGDRFLRLEEGRLWEETALGERQLGQVLHGRSYLWGGAGLAFVYSEAGALSSAWIALPGRQTLTQAVLPRRVGTLERIHCLFGTGCVWLLQARREQGRIQHGCLLFDDHGGLLASAEEEAGAGTWLDAPWGAMAAGRALYLPGDHLLRVSAVGPSLAVDREFPDTAPYADSGVTLLPGPAGIYVVRRSTIHLLVQH